MSQVEFWKSMVRLGACVAAAAQLSACSDDKQERTPPLPVPVHVAVAQLQDFQLRLKSLGTVTPLNSVIVRSRTDGELVRVLFDEGQTVKQGQLLAQIDPRPREVALAEAEGRRQESLVQLQNAEQEMARMNDLLAKNFVSKQMVTNQEAVVRQSQARLETADAAVASAKLQLDFTRIVAPISGRLGLRRVDAGNLVRSGDADGLVTITQVQPISAVFTIPETEVTALLDSYRKNNDLAVEAWDRDERQLLAAGKLSGLDNQIDTATGTLRLKAEFSNQDNRLFPNQFVNVRLMVSTVKNAVVIPGAAVQYGANAKYVFVIEDGKSMMREVKLGAADNDRIIVLEGLKGGEQIVLEGLERLRDGRAVEIVDPNAPSVSKAAASKKKGGEGARKRPNGEGRPDGGPNRNRGPGPT
jgi:multidrug efflux system membrane fusion protein